VSIQLHCSGTVIFGGVENGKHGVTPACLINKYEISTRIELKRLAFRAYKIQSTPWRYGTCAQLCMLVMLVSLNKPKVIPISGNETAKRHNFY
jgi:hypothetical protein